MSASRISRALLRRGAVAGALLVVVAGAGPTAAAPHGYDFVGAPYAAVIGADAVMPFLDLGGELAGHVGAAAVALDHDPGERQPRCRVYGAGYWLGEGVEKDTLGDTGSGVGMGVGLAGGVPGLPSSPAAPAMTLVPGGVYYNPSVTYRANPDPGPRQEWGGRKIPSMRDPGLRYSVVPGGETITVALPAEPTVAEGTPAHGATPTWTAGCAGPMRGTALARIARVAGFGAVSSTSTAVLSRATGVYTGAARTAISEVVTAAGSVGVITSLLAVRAEPGTEPLVTYRLRFAPTRSGEGRTGLAEQEFVLAGTEVPSGELVEQFNTAAEAMAAPIRTVLGPAGLQLLAPVVEVVPGTGRFRILAPVLAGHAGLASRHGGVGSDQGVRLGATWLEHGFAARAGHGS